MGQYKSPTAERGAMRLKSSIIEVVLDALVEEVGFGDEQIGAFRCSNQRIGPLRVTGIADDFLLVLDTNREWRRAAEAFDL